MVSLKSWISPLTVWNSLRTLLSQHLDHHVVRGFIDEGDHHLLSVDRIDSVFILFGSRLGYLPDRKSQVRVSGRV